MSSRGVSRARPCPGGTQESETGASSVSSPPFPSPFPPRQLAVHDPRDRTGRDIHQDTLCLPQRPACLLLLLEISHQRWPGSPKCFSGHFRAFPGVLPLPLAGPLRQPQANISFVGEWPKVCRHMRWGGPHPKPL